MPRPWPWEITSRSGAVPVQRFGQWRFAQEEWFGGDADAADAALMRMVAQCGCVPVSCVAGSRVCVCVLLGCLLGCAVAFRNQLPPIDLLSMETAPWRPLFLGFGFVCFLWFLLVCLV